jgi:hypothetical protein
MKHYNVVLNVTLTVNGRFREIDCRAPYDDQNLKRKKEWIIVQGNLKHMSGPVNYKFISLSCYTQT